MYALRLWGLLYNFQFKDSNLDKGRRPISVGEPNMAVILQ